MTDRTDHRAAAERMLADADDWAAQAGELSPKASERACLAYAQVHALLAIADTLAAKPELKPLTITLNPERLDGLDQLVDFTRGMRDIFEAQRYAANEAKQREAEPDPLDPSMAECSRCGQAHPGTSEAALEHHRACTGETPENPMGDPLDEDDHRDRLDRDGDIWGRKPGGCWHDPILRGCGDPDCVLTLAYLNERYGPLTFAPEAAQYTAMLEAQHYSCAICHSPEPGPFGWSVDHDHACCPGRKSCGKCVRGVLCHGCNTGLGLFNDNPDTLAAAIEYLTGFAARGDGVMANAAQPPQDSTGGDLSADEGESEHGEGGEAEESVEPLLCECGHDIDWHMPGFGCIDTCPCFLAASDIARALIEQAVKQAGGGRG